MQNDSTFNKFYFLLCNCLIGDLHSFVSLYTPEAVILIAQFLRNEADKFAPHQLMREFELALIDAQNLRKIMSWIAYTDGGAAPSNPGPAAWGAVIITPEKIISHHNGFIGHGTNQIAELTAAIEGLLRVPAGSKVELVSDSQYVLKGLTEWRGGWERNGMRNSKKEIVANLELWQQLYLVADARKVVTRWIKGHSGDKHNEQADVLVGQAIALRRSSTV